MIRRPRRSTPATIVATVLLALCVLLAVRGRPVPARADPDPGSRPVARGHLGAALEQRRHRRGGDRAGRARPRPADRRAPPRQAHRRPAGPHGIPGCVVPGADVGVRRATLAEDFATTAGAVAGVTAADVSARRSRITATVPVAAADPAAVPGQVLGERLEARVAAIGPVSSTEGPGPGPCRRERLTPASPASLATPATPASPALPPDREEAAPWPARSGPARLNRTLLLVVVIVLLAAAAFTLLTGSGVLDLVPALNQGSTPESLSPPSWVCAP